MSFQKGESGNPAGRPRGSRNRATLLMESLLADDAEAIGRKAIEMSPPRKGEPVAFDLPPLDKPADSVAAVAKIAAAVAAGELTPSEAAELAKVIDVYVRAIETKAFDERLAKLEGTTQR